MATKAKPEQEELAGWGDYAELCQQFAEKVKALPEVKAVKAHHCGDYVDVWVVVNADVKSRLRTEILNALDEVWARFPNLPLDFFITQHDDPTDSVDFYRRGV